MTQDEAEKFLSDIAFPAFPGPCEWLYERSPNSKATLAVWTNVLTKITLSDAKRVIDGWLDGSIPMFAWTDREAWATAIVRTSRELNRPKDLRAESERIMAEIGQPQRDVEYEPLLPKLQAMLGVTTTPAVYETVKAPRETAKVSEEHNRQSILKYLTDLQKEAAS